MSEELQYFAIGIISMLIVYAVTMVVITKLPDDRQKE